MLWLKAFHIFSVVSWFAGLLYLPRLFVNHAEATEPVVRERLKVMERRLLKMTRVGAVLTAVFGFATLGWWQAHDPQFIAHNGWIQLKLVLVLALYGYHGLLVRMTRQFATDSCTRSPRWLRIFNEIPALLLIAVVILVVVKPF